MTSRLSSIMKCALGEGRAAELEQMMDEKEEREERIRREFGENSEKMKEYQGKEWQR